MEPVNQGREERDALKQEYLRGLTEAEQVQKECTVKFLEVVKDRLTKAIDSTVTAEDAQDEMEKIIQLIDEYGDGEIPVAELIEREKKREEDEIEALEDRVEELGTRRIVSLSEFVREDF